MNESLIIFIPKLEGPEEMTHFRAIVLCNVTTKLITMIIANHLKHLMNKLVRPN